MSALKKLSPKVHQLKYGKDAFWHERYNSKGDKSISILIPELRSFLKDQGFSRYEGRLVHIKDNMAQLVTPEDIFSFALKNVETYKDKLLEGAFIKEGESLIIKNKAVLIGLPECELEPLKDTLKKSYHLYRNGIVLVDHSKEASLSDEFRLIEYKDVKKFVWKDQIHDRDFEIMENPQDAMFSKFLRNVTNNDDHYHSVCSAMGYLLHGYKDERNPKGVIINDENINDDGKPQGGTGKGLIVKALSKLVEQATYNGKNVDFRKDKFAFERVELTSRLFVIDDVNRNFDLEDIFNAMTEDMVVRKIYTQPEKIPFKLSPKYVITTNYTIRGNSSSFKRRRVDVFLNNHYSDRHTPSDDFGCEFFHEWDEKEWKRFDYFMMSCLGYYLACGFKHYESKEIKEKMFKNETSADFLELMKNSFSMPGNRYYKSELRDALIFGYGESYKFLNNKHHIVKDWINQYAEFMKINVSHGKDMRGAWFEFKQI